MNDYVGSFMRLTVKRFGGERVELGGEELLRVMSLFREEAETTHERVLQIPNGYVMVFMYKYGGYSLFVYYFENRLLFFVLEGEGETFNVVSKSVWDQK